MTSAANARAPHPAPSPARAAAVLLLVLVPGVLFRLPALPLPLDEEGARIATRAAHLAGRGPALPGEAPAAGPLLPVLLVPLVTAGLSPTTALRGLDAFLGALLAPLAVVLARRFGVQRGGALRTGALLALHPLLVTHAGGAAAGSESLTLALLLAALILLAGRTVASRRAGAVFAVLMPLSTPLAAAYLPGLLWAYLRTESAARTRAAFLGLGAVALLLTPTPALTGPVPGPLGERALAFAVLWLPVASLALLLLAALPAGVRRLAGREGVARLPARAWLAGSALHLLLALLLPTAATFGWGWDGLRPGAALAVVLVVGAGAGVEAWRAGTRRRWGRAALALGLALTVWAAWGPAQTWMRPDDPHVAGRLHRLGRALSAAGAAAGEDGWVALDLGPAEFAFERRLADRLGAGRVGTLRRPQTTIPPERLPPLPLAELPRGAAVGIVTRQRPAVLGVSTLGGQGIFLQEPVARLGPWLVLRARRP